MCIRDSWWPDPYVFDIFDDHGIKAVVNVCEFDNRKDVPAHLDYHFIHVPDYGVPTQAQIDHFLNLMDKHHAAGEPAVIHCVAGCGRTGQFSSPGVQKLDLSLKERTRFNGSVRSVNAA